jgi:hypothetical protein
MARVTAMQEEKKESLNDEVEQILEEARMVLPGLQALFGFQLIAVFNERFSHDLADPQKRLHLAAVVLTAIAIGLIMAPAAYHRHAERDRVSRYFANYASSLITVAMAPLAVALSIEVTLVSALITENSFISWTIGCVLLTFLTWLWFVFPAYRKRAGGSASAAKRPRTRR